MRRVILVAAIAMMNGDTQVQPAPEPGVSAALAHDRAARVRDVRYDLAFRIPAEQSAPVQGRATVRFRLTDTTGALALDFARSDSQVTGVTAGGRRIEAGLENGHVVLPAHALAAGENEIGIEFTAGDAPLNRNPDYLYTIFVPARAHLAFPCFDQPDLKARYALRLDVPAGWEAISNGEIVEQREEEGRIHVRFAETKAVSTYLFAFAAGRFSVERAQRGSRRFRMLHRETDAQKVARNRDAIFDLHAAALEWLERYTGIPYPFGKFEFLLVPSFQFGGMEHPGAIFYNASGLLLDPSATQNQKLGRASVIAHETAHMWFGDLVTMRWFDDVWMKEVFANFMAAKIVNPSFPEINHDLRFLFAHYPAAYDVDRTAGTNAIRQKLDNLNEAGSLYGAIIYQKAPIVMRQLEMMLGEDVFRDGVREYLTAHAFGNATWTDLIRLLDARTPEDLQAWSGAWVEEAGRPVFTMAGMRVDGESFTAGWIQQDPVPARGLLWSQPLTIAVGYPDRQETIDLHFTRREVHAVRPHLDRRQPLYVLPTGGGLGYGDFVLDPASRQYLTSHLADVPDALTRGAALVTLWEEMLGGRIEPAAIAQMLATALPRETDELNVQRMLSYLERAFWKFLPASERETRAPALERMLRGGLHAAKTPSVKSAWFNALRDTALTRDTLAWLGRVWAQTEAVPGLTLAEPDYITLAQQLAVREVDEWRRILDEQAARIQNPDRKARFEFVRPALSSDPAERDRFFAGLKDVGNRRREAWVLEAVSYLHHPLRAAQAEGYIPPSLALLREIQQTGDIFFPKRWMDATLGGHASPSAARMVRSFLERLPAGYPERLRRIVLSAADELFRASR